MFSREICDAGLWLTQCIMFDLSPFGYVTLKHQTRFFFVHGKQERIYLTKQNKSQEMLSKGTSDHFQHAVAPSDSLR